MWSRKHEIKYWKRKGLEKGKEIYVNYQKLFELEKYDFKSKKIIDIGCGPFGGVLGDINGIVTSYHKCEFS